MKKKQEIVIKIQDFEIFQKYISPDYNKLVCINVFDKFWGPCEVMDPMVKKLLDTKDTAAKIDFICADKDRGSIIVFIDGLDFPKLQEDLEKNLHLLETE